LTFFDLSQTYLRLTSILLNLLKFKRSNTNHNLYWAFWVLKDLILWLVTQGKVSLWEPSEFSTFVDLLTLKVSNMKGSHNKTFSYTKLMTIDIFIILTKKTQGINHSMNVPRLPMDQFCVLFTKVIERSIYTHHSWIFIFILNLQKSLWHPSCNPALYLYTWWKLCMCIPRSKSLDARNSCLMGCF
jgi:hypothetical protein